MTDNNEHLNTEIIMSENTQETTKPLSPFDEIHPVDGIDGTARDAAMSVPVHVEVVVGRSKVTVADNHRVRMHTEAVARLRQSKSSFNRSPTQTIGKETSVLNDSRITKSGGIGEGAVL